MNTYSSSIVSRPLDGSFSPILVSSPDVRTPDVAIEKNGNVNGTDRNGVNEAELEPIDANGLSKALKDYEEAGRLRERTPGGSPSRKRQRVYGDRLVGFLAIAAGLPGPNESQYGLLSEMDGCKLTDHLLTRAGVRFIPNREGQDLQASFSLLYDDASPTTPSRVKKRTPHGELHFQKSKSIA